MLSTALPLAIMAGWISGSVTIRSLGLAKPTQQRRFTSWLLGIRSRRCKQQIRAKNGCKCTLSCNKTKDPEVHCPWIFLFPHIPGIKLTPVVCKPIRIEIPGVHHLRQFHWRILALSDPGFCKFAEYPVTRALAFLVRVPTPGNGWCFLSAPTHSYITVLASLVSSST